MASLGDRGDKLDLLVRQGATLGPYPVQLTDDSVPVDLTGCQIRAMMRKSYASATGIPFEVEISAPLTGDFIFSIAAETTAGITCGASPNDPASQYVWDLEIEYPDGTVMPVFYGAVKVAPEATR